MPHDEYACYGSPRHCSGCGEDEPLEPCYLRCFECGHIFNTAEDLLREHNAIIDSLNRQYPHAGCPVCDENWDLATPVPHETDASQVWTCPVCIHDF